jgi:hypothetical protein
MNRKMKKYLLSACMLTLFTLVHNQGAMASGRAACPGAEEGGIGIIATKSTDMEGSVYANGATGCTIKFHGNHKTAFYCKARVLCYIT